MKGQEIHRALQVIEVFRTIDPEMPIQQASAFLYIALHEGGNMKAITEHMGMALHSTSRNVAALSIEHRLKRPGYGLVEKNPDPYESRRMIITLLPKGRRVAEALSNIMEGP